MNVTEAQLRELIGRGLHSDGDLRCRYDALDNSESNRRIFDSGICVVHQPWRIRSSAANVDAADSRPCFLCLGRRLPWQESLPLAPLQYEVVVNPYPVMHNHLTIISTVHRPQQFGSDEAADFAALAYAWPGTTIFFNGARCGASAPDHMHFQAIVGWRSLADNNALAPHITLTATTPAEATEKLTDTLAALKTYLGIDSSMLNIASVPQADGMPPLIRIFPRRALRPESFTSSPDESADGVMVSPAAVEMLGVIVAPRRCDFDRLTPRQIDNIYSETGIPRESLAAGESSAHMLLVGIMSAPEIHYTLQAPYISGSEIFLPGEYVADQPIRLRPLNPDATFTLHDVTIGKAFHWQRKQQQTFRGVLDIIAADDADDDSRNTILTAINIIDIEEYLYSVIASEMSQNALLEFLKAHAVISRSWVMKQIENRRDRQAPAHTPSPAADVWAADEIVRWYDRDDHTLFDVCADDHCQRYQGIGHIVNASVADAIDLTRGEVLVDRCGHICDARFSKCCGGKFEEFENCWQPTHFHYLESLTDTERQSPLPDLCNEAAANDWITSSPDAFCNCNDSGILQQVLNNYDRDMPDFYRWTETFTAEELSAIVEERSGIDFGTVTDLVPLTRGSSGRIVRLKIVGTSRSVIVGKELEIRRWLSHTHLRSSAFVVERSADGSQFTLHGAGWGHGVGLCQIGAAVMASRGFTYHQILQHYFPGSNVEKR